MNYFKLVQRKFLMLGDSEIRNFLTNPEYQSLVEESNLSTEDPSLMHTVWDVVRHSHLSIDRSPENKRLVLVLDNESGGHIAVEDKHLYILDGDTKDEAIQDIINDYINKGIVSLMYTHYKNNRTLLDVQALYGEVTEQMERLNERKKDVIKLLVTTLDEFRVGDKVEINLDKNIGGFGEKMNVVVERQLAFIDAVLPRFKNGLPHIEYKFRKCKKDGTISQHTMYMYHTTKKQLNIKLIDRKND